MIQDKYERIGEAQGSVADTLTPTPVGNKGATSSAPYPLGGNGEVPPLDAARLANPPPIAGGVPPL